MESIVTIIAEKVAQPIVDYTVAPIARQVGYLIFYNNNFKNLKDQVAELKGVKDTISQQVKEERRHGRQIHDAVQNWLNKVDEIVEEAEQLSDNPRHMNVGCCKGPFPDLKSRHQLSRKATKMAGNVVEVMQRKDKIGPLAFLPELEGVGSTCATSSEKLESRKKMKEDIVLALKDPSLSRIGVYGLGGVGKTTLVKEIAEQVKDDQLFDEVVMANISQDVDLERIQGEIADFLGLQFEERTVVGRASRLKQRIKNEKSILFILDDIWEILELDKLGIPLNDHKGCKLLLTSRNLEILQKMEIQKDFLIDVLNEEEAWSLFEDMVGDVVKDVSLCDMAIQVAQKCAGLTVLIVSVARALKNKDNIDSWKDALNQLKAVDKEGVNEKIYSALEYSYNHLEGDDVKALFLLCGLLGSQNTVEHLLKYAMGLGIFKQIDSPKDARFKFHRLIGSLKASCLLLESNLSKNVKMHDIVREIAVSIASRDQNVCKIGKADELWPSEEFLQRCTQIILDGCHIPKLPDRFECPNIKLFYLNSTNESLRVPDSFFEGMKNLKVLDLTSIELTPLPQSFHSLIGLHTLCLNHCALEDMTNIGALTNLQILSLYGSSSMLKLPSELGQLTHLRMLDLTNAEIKIFPFNILSKLTKLELYLGNTSIKWDQEDSVEENKNASLTELKHLTNLTALEIQIKGAWVLPRVIKFEKLERYKIVIGDVWEWSDNYGASKMLKLKLSTVIHLEHGIKELIKGVEDLYLDEVNGIFNVLYDLNGEGFPLLKHLHIQNNGEIQYIINSMGRQPSHVFFQKLETLVLQNLNKLEKICHGSFMNNSFAKLRSVKVKCCDELKYLFSVLMVKALCQLVEIEVSECNSMKNIVFVENSLPNPMTVDDNIEFCSLLSLTLRCLPTIEDFYSGLLTSSTTTKQSLSSYTDVPSSFFNAKVRFSNLETLKLSSIHLENIWLDDHFSVANSFPQLANLSVKNCSHMKYLFSSFVIGSFPNLKKLEIRECEMMEEIIGTEGRNDTAIEEVGLPKLETVVISNMKSLKKAWHSQLDGLKTMEVNNCEKLENIFPSDMHTTFGRIETLNVSDCASMKEIFKLPANEINSQEDTQLKKLHLLRLPKLKQIWSKDPQGNFLFHHLQDVHVENCENLEYLFPFSIALDLQQLEKLTVEFCGMDEIVAMKDETMEKPAIFPFDRLYSLEILNMHRLDRFYGGSHSLTCPSLRITRVFNCANFNLFGRQGTSNHRKNADDRNPNVSTQHSLFIIEEMTSKLEEWTLNNEEAIMTLQDPQWKDHCLSELKVLRLSNFESKVAAIFLDSIVQKAPNLKRLVVEYSSLKEIFRGKRVEYKEGEKKTNTQLELLRLTNLQLQHVCREGCKIDPILELLQVLCVTECANLKNLVPSSVSFSHLTYLEIEKCNGLVNLIYLSTATSLVKLEGMTLKECNSLEEIVPFGMNETIDEIVFRSLRTLELKSLPRLNSFSSSHCFFKFPVLEKLVVRQCPRMKTFCVSALSTPMLRKVIIKEGKDEDWRWQGDLNTTIKKIYVDEIAFRNMEHLDLCLYPELRDSWNSLVENRIFCNLKSLVLEQCDFLSDVLLPSSLLQALGNLEEIQARDCDSLEVVFEFNTVKEEASHLRKICLSNLPKLQYIWKSRRQQPLSFIAKVLLPKLETIILEDMKNLKTIWHPAVTPNSMGSFETLKVKNCQKIKHIFPTYMHEAFATLETLMVEDCNSVHEIFQFGVNQMHNGDDTSRLKNITLLRLPKLKQIWSQDLHSSHGFKNLQAIRVEDCEDLDYLFPFSIAMNLPLLEQITIKQAKRMKKIISKRKKPVDKLVTFEFKSLNSMVLWNLDDLEGFCAGNHSLACHSLKELDVIKCMKLKLFNTKGVSSQGKLYDGNLQVSMQHPLFTLEEMIGNLEKLALSNDDVRIILQGQFSGELFSKLKILTLQEIEDDQMIFPYWFLQNITSLEQLIVAWSPFKEIFSEEVPINPKEKIGNTTRIKNLTLKELHELQHICKEGCQINPVLEVLEYLDVVGCSNLKRLVPSSVTFNHLTYLEVQNCQGMIYLITSSTARSLVKLTTMKIKECDSIEEIVAEKGGDSIDEIAFNSLEILELDSLSKLQMFCSSNCLLKLPMLEKLLIRQCPRMKNLSQNDQSAPLLREMLTDEQDEKWFCGGYLNSTVNKMPQDKLPMALRSFNRLEVSLCSSAELWYSQVQPEVFGNLKDLVLQKCGFLSKVLLPFNLLKALSNIEKLEVSECDSVEALIELPNMNEGRIMEKLIVHLKRINLSCLPQLKHIWSFENFEEISSDNSQGLHGSKIQGFRETTEEGDIRQVLLPELETVILEDTENLETIWHPVLTPNSMSSFETLKVKNCQKTKNIFPTYMHGAFATLETLKVQDCNSVQEIFQLDVYEMHSGYDATQLKNITLLRLPQLKQIWSGDPQSSLSFKTIQVVHVEDCGDLEYIFPFSIVLNLPLLEQITIKQAEKMKAIVSGRQFLDNPVRFEFNKLTSMVLWNLQNLQGFFVGYHNLSCSSLKELNVYNCEKLKLFKIQGTSSQGILSYYNLHVSMQQPLFTLEEVVDNLEALSLDNKDDSMIFQSQVPRDQFPRLKFLRLSKLEDDQATSPYWFLRNISSLKELVIQNNSFKVIFPNERPPDENGEVKIRTGLKKLMLHNLYELQHICKEECQLDSVLDVLEYLDVDECSKLKKLIPSSVTLNHLTYLEVKNCSGLIYLITSSTATSLVKLTTLKIRECDLVEQVVAEEGGEYNNEVEFSSLEVLELQYLPKLNCFGSKNCCLKLPVLEKLVIMQCPRMKTFWARGTSAPLLREIVTNEQDEKWFYEGDLNSTVNKIFQHMVAFRNLENLELSQYPELKQVWYSQNVQSGVFSNLKNLSVKDCGFLSDVLLPLNLLQGLPKLQEVDVSECDSLEAVFDLTNMHEKENIHLKTINLSRLPGLKHIWKQNSHQIVNFDNSQGFKISKIQGTRETEKEDKGDQQHQQQASLVGQVLLPKLETIIIEDMEKLETIWHPVLNPNSMGSFETLKVKHCQKIERVFPIYMCEAFASLETLKVEDCNSVQEIFQLGVNDMCSGDDTTQLKNITLLQLPKLKQIWSRDPQSSLCFKNMQVVCVEDCEDLEYLFPFSIAMNLPLLEQITIKQAKRIKEIVSKREEHLDNLVKFEFRSLTSLVLWNLHDLEGFFAGNHSLACPSLKELDFFRCMKLKLFNTHSPSSQEILSDVNLQVSMQQPLFRLEEVMCNLEKLTLSSEHVNILLQGHFSGEHFKKLKVLTLQESEDDQTTFPFWFLQNMTALEHLIVEWSSFKEIFSEEVTFNQEGNFWNTTCIKILTLNQLHELQHICKEGYQTDPILEVLEYLDVDECSKLKNLVPSCVTFNHLTYLEVQNCKGLIYLITSSTARSLVKLTTLKIRECDSIEEIVVEKEGDSRSEFGFYSLEVLELDSLSKLQMFCSSNCLLKLPLLEKLVIRQCPRMTSFSTGETSAPLLQKILTDEQDGIWCWEGDLNRTVNKMFQDKVAFRSFNHLEFSKYPELKELWYGQVGQKLFCNLKHLVVRQCTFLSNVIFSSNLLQLLYTLEELEVAECDSLETVFDVKALDDKSIESKEVSRLKKLTLLKLPNLKRIWNREAGEIISFENLQILKADKCQQLQNLFSVSLCQDLRQLEELRIESCGVEQIVSIEEGLEELKFEFPQLTVLQLFNVTQLTNFCSKRYTLECPSLQSLNVCGCEKLQIFAFDLLNPQTPREGDTELQIEQALFSIDKVPQNLEELSLNEKDAMRILNGNYEKNLLQSIEVLRLQYFQETPVKFLNDLIQIFSGTTTLQVRCSSFETLFHSEEIGHCSIERTTQIKALRLFQLEQLGHIWSDDDSASHPLLQNLEDLFISECSEITRLAPPSASFKNLTSLEVKDCNGLLYFMTSCTAKTLVHLTNLEVSNCGMLEEVVMMDEGESEEEIIFESLKYLVLTCLSSFKSFCCGKQTFIFSSLVTLKVVGCHKMQNFSSGVIIVPFLKLVEVENGKKRWKEDLNTTIKQLFIEKAIEGGVEGDYKESSSINIQSSQMHQKSVSTSRGLGSEEHGAESKADEIVDSRKQEKHKLPIPRTRIGTQKICEIVETPLDQASQNTLNLTKVDAALGTQDETIERRLVQATHQDTLSLSRVRDQDIRNQEMCKTLEKTFPAAEDVRSSSMVDNIANDPSPSQALEAVTSPMRDEDKSQDLQLHSSENLLVQDTKSVMNDDEENTEAKEMHETIQRPLVHNAKDMLIQASVQDIDGSQDSQLHLSENSLVRATKSIINDDEEVTRTHVTHESIDKPFVQATQNTWDIIIVQEKEESQDLDIQLSKNLFNQTITYMAANIKETVGAQETYESKRMFSVHDAQKKQNDPEIILENGLSCQTTNSVMVENKEPTDSALSQDSKATSSSTPLITDVFLAIGTQGIHKTIDKALIENDQDAKNLAIAQYKEESRDLHIETQKICDTMEKPSILSAQNVPSSSMITKAASDSSPSQGPEPVISSIQKSNMYRNYNEVIDIPKQNMPYLEIGVNRHPQVLDWLNTTRRRAFASSFFSLFAEVTRILRTTRKVDLTEDDRNYIRECCTVLKGVGFDESWISYVHGCIEECEDGEDLMRKVEEAEAQASNLKAQLESINKDLALLRDKASRLHDFIES